MTERARKSQTLAGENSFQKHLQLRLPCMLRAHEREEPSHVFQYKERRANVGKRKGEAPCDAGRVPHGHRETGRGRGGAASGAPGLGTDGDAGGRHGQRGPGRRVTEVPAMLLWTQRKGPGIALDLGPDPIGHIQPQDQEGVRGSRRTAGKASAGNCLLVLCHAHHMTPSSLPPEKKRGRSGPPPPHPELRARTGRVRTPWAVGLCSSHHVLPVGGQVRPTPKGFKHRSPKSARARPRAFRHPVPCTSAGSVRL